MLIFTFRFLSKVNYTALKEDAGIRAIVFDKDNTLTSPYENTLHPAAAPGIARAMQVFGNDMVGTYHACGRRIKEGRFVSGVSHLLSLSSRRQYQYATTTNSKKRFIHQPY